MAASNSDGIDDEKSLTLALRDVNLTKMFSLMCTARTLDLELVVLIVIQDLFRVEGDVKKSSLPL